MHYVDITKGEKNHRQTNELYNKKKVKLNTYTDRFIVFCFTCLLAALIYKVFTAWNVYRVAAKLKILWSILVGLSSISSSANS